MSIKKYIDRLKASKDGRTVFANFGYLSLLQIAGYVFPFITMPYLARVIGAEGFGKIAFALSVVTWVQTISDWGFNFTATRDVAQNRDNKDVVSQILSNVLWARCLLTILTGILLAIVVVFVPYFRENAAIIFATYLLVPGYVLFPEWFFQAIEKMKYTTIFNLIIKLVFTGAVFIFIKEKSDYIWQPLLVATGYFLCGIASLYLILHKWGYRMRKPRWHAVIITIRNSTDVFINNLMPNLYNSFSVMLLGFVDGAVANGLYEGGNKFPNMYNRLQTALSRAFFPFLSRRFDKHGLYVKINMGVAILGAILLFAFAPWVIEIMLGSEFKGSVSVMRILSVSVIFYAMSNTYGTNYLIVHHQEKILRKVTVIASVIGMALAIPLVVYYSYIGAACVILISRCLLGTLSYFAVCKVRKGLAQEK